MKNSEVCLLDANVLIALATPDHSAHTRAASWFRSCPAFATCPITQGALIRFFMRWAELPNIGHAKRLLGEICALPKHRFWPDNIAYLTLPEKGVTGHRQVTDVYLVRLAEEHGGRLATMDEALAAVHPVARLI
jgi:toxin-antitoxin system PIN domain toxin